jgi:hypothetical protein
MGETLRQKLGPVPVWTWALAFVAVLYFYLKYRKNKATAAAAAANAQTGGAMPSNLGNVPVSNLTTTAQPMPIQMGDTFVNTTVPNTVNVSPSTTVNNQVPSGTLQPVGVPAPSPVVIATQKPAPAPAPAPVQTLPGFGSGLKELLGLNPGLLSANTPGGQNIPGITGYQVSYNGVPL